MLTVVAYPLTNGRSALVDAGDVPILDGRRWRAYPFRSTFYAVCDERCANKTRRIYMHRLILGLAGQRYPFVDHDDGDGLNNTRLNIAPASCALNTQKARRKSSKFRGVFVHRNGFMARCGKRYAGFFLDEVEAARAYDAMVLSVFGPRAMTNEREGLYGQ